MIYSEFSKHSFSCETSCIDVATTSIFRLRRSTLVENKRNTAQRPTSQNADEIYAEILDNVNYNDGNVNATSYNDQIFHAGGAR